jgi:hypothetical protein
MITPAPRSRPRQTPRIGAPRDHGVLDAVCGTNSKSRRHNTSFNIHSVETLADVFDRV